MLNLVDLLTLAAIREMIIPSLLPVLSPIVLYFVILAIGGQAEALAAVGAMLLRCNYNRFICSCFNDCWWWCLG